jgi:putative ABC transport system permease protein
MRTLLSHAWQGWKRAPGVAVLAALALAVGIGSSTAIYTVVNAVMLRPLPYAEGDRFVALYGATVSDPNGRSSHTFPRLIEYQQRTRSFDVFGWYTPRNFNLTSPGAPQLVQGAAVTTSLAHHLGVNPLIGTWFHDDTGAVISHALWTSLGANPALVGSPITLNGRTYSVAGVMPPAFRLPLAGAGGGKMQNDVWIALDPRGRGQSPSEAFFFCYARLKPGVTLAQARADVQRAAAEIARQDPTLRRGYTARLDNLHADAVETIRPTLLLLLAAAGVLLLITCANVAGLLLTRAVGRARETAIRVALGAGHRSLALQYFVEGLVVSAIGAAAGVGASLALVRLVVSVAAAYIPRAEDVAIDWRVLVFAIAVTCLASALSSLAPLWQAMRTQPTDVLRDGVRVTAGIHSRRVSRALVVAEIALAFTLLAISAVLIAHLGRLSRVWPGFDADHLVAFQLNVSEAIAPEPAFSGSPKRSAYHQRLLDGVSALPGLTGVALVNQLPLDGCCTGAPIYAEGATANGGAVPPTEQRNALLAVSPGYLQTMRIPLRAGRFLTAEDGHGSNDLLSVVINETAARTFWPNRQAVGASGRLGGPDGARFQVVGIAGDVRNDSLAKRVVPEIYLSSAVLPINPIWFVVRSPLPTGAVMADVRRAIAQIEPAQPIHGVTTMREIAHQSLALERVGSLMMTGFALAALLMAILGVYGVISYTVRQNRVEIGVRMALGAVNRDVLLLFLGSGLKMAAYGVAIGALGVMTSAGLLVRVLRIDEPGWLPFATSTLVVTGIALIASFVPAWRATLVTPMVAIRDESS